MVIYLVRCPNTMLLTALPVNLLADMLMVQLIQAMLGTLPIQVVLTRDQLRWFRPTITQIQIINSLPPILPPPSNSQVPPATSIHKLCMAPQHHR